MALSAEIMHIIYRLILCLSYQEDAGILMARLGVMKEKLGTQPTQDMAWCIVSTAHAKGHILHAYRIRAQTYLHVVQMTP